MDQVRTRNDTSPQEWRSLAYKYNLWGERDPIQCYCGKTFKHRWGFSMPKHFFTKTHQTWLSSGKPPVPKKKPSYYYPEEKGEKLFLVPDASSEDGVKAVPYSVYRELLEGNKGASGR